MMRKIVLIVAFAVIASLSASPARAALLLSISDSASSSTVIVIGGGSGVITYSGTVGSWDLNMNTGVASPFFEEGYLHLHSLEARNDAGAPATDLTIMLTQTDLTAPLSAWTMNYGGTYTGAGNVTYSAFRDNTNAQFGTGTLIGTLGPFSGAYSGSLLGGAAGVTPYSLTERIVLAAGAGKLIYSGDAELLPAVPEPGTLTLFGTGLFGLAKVVRRRSRKEPLA